MGDYKCEKCNRFFQSQEGLDSHTKDKHFENISSSSSKSNWHMYAVVCVVILIVVGFGVFVLMSTKPGEQPKYNRELPKAGFHWHPTLHIFIKGQEVPIPANIGLVPVEQPIHTHENDNVLHYEFGSAPTFREVKIGHFFEIWGKTFNKTCIFEYCNGENGTVKFYVNGQPNEYFDDYIPYDLEKIEIKYE